MGEDGTSGFEAIALQFELGDTKRLLDVARRENTELHDKNQGLTAEKGRLQAALEDTNQLLDEARRENTKLQADYGRVQVEAEGLQSEIAQLKAVPAAHADPGLVLI